MSNNKEKDEEKPIVAKTAVDLQRLKLMKLMKNPDKPIILPERPKPKNTPTVPEFVRNVMGSSAGAGSGEFHVYRHLRRKEYARQKFIQEKGYKELLDAEYHEKLEQNKRQAEEATAKRRAKRLKRKQKMKERKKMKCTNAATNNKKENMDMQHSDTDDSDAIEETDKNRRQSSANEVTSMEIECLREVENKEQMEVEDKEYRENNENSVQSDLIGSGTVMNCTIATEVKQIKETESKEKNEVKHKEEKEKTEAEHKVGQKMDKMEHEEDQKKSEVGDEEERKEKSEVENKEVNKGKSGIEHKEVSKGKREIGDEEESKGKNEVEHEEEDKGNDKTNMVSSESMDKEAKEDK